MLVKGATDYKIVLFLFQDNAKYWPNKSEAPLNVGKIQVQLERETSMKHYTIRDLNVSDKSGVSGVRPRNHAHRQDSIKIEYKTFLLLMKIHFNGSVQDYSISNALALTVVSKFGRVEYRLGCAVHHFVFTWWRHQMKTFTGLLCGEFTGDRWIPLKSYNCPGTNEPKLWTIWLNESRYFTWNVYMIVYGYTNYVISLGTYIW